VIPYQGSKRRLAPRILACVEGRRFERLFEPFAGSAAITIAAAARDIAGEYRVSDTLGPLVLLWQAVIGAPQELADRYEAIWQAQHLAPDHYDRVRDSFNADGDPAELLYLLARCVKNAPRFNAQGAFNQSADKRRAGMKPATARRNIAAASELLLGRAEASCAEVEDALEAAGPGDLVYLDPPWEGTTVGSDKRYHQGFDRERLVQLLDDLDARGVPYLLSYDGRLGERTYGEALPARLDVERFELDAGRSAQATLSGRRDLTVESLYVSRSLLRAG